MKKSKDEGTEEKREREWKHRAHWAHEMRSNARRMKPKQKQDKSKPSGRQPPTKEIELQKAAIEFDLSFNQFHII